MDSQLKEQIKLSAGTALTELDCPGMLVRVHSQKHGMLAFGVGYNDLHSTVPMPEDGRFYIFSPSKTLTAICILKLLEAGMLTLGQRVNELFPGLSLNPDITILQLLNHTSGIVDYCSLRAYHEDVAKYPSKPWQEAKFLAMTLSRKQDFEPGSQWHYCNTGYLLLKNIITLLTGLEYSAAIEHFISEPLGLSATYAATEIDTDKTLLPGFDYFSDPSAREDVRAIYHPDWCATGVVVSTTAELEKIFRALFTGKILSADSLAWMKTAIRVPGEHPPAVTPSYGLGLMVDLDFEFGRSYAHGGSGPGFNTWIEYLPDVKGDAVSLCFVCNASLPNHPHQLRLEILKLLMDG